MKNRSIDKSGQGYDCKGAQGVFLGNRNMLYIDLVVTAQVCALIKTE